jgi:hypothetical protein
MDGKIAPGKKGFAVRVQAEYRRLIVVKWNGRIDEPRHATTRLSASPCSKMSNGANKQLTGIVPFYSNPNATSTCVMIRKSLFRKTLRK